MVAGQYNVSSDVNGIPGFKRKALVVAIAAATTGLSVVAFAGDIATTSLPHKEWVRNTELFYNYREGGNSRAGIRVLAPIRQGKDTLTYFDGRFINSEGPVLEGNLSLGQRWLLGNNQWILGAQGGYDYRKSASDRGYDQLNVGIEALSENFDFIANYYLPLTDEELIGTDNTSGQFDGRRLVLNGIYEEALEGFDIEAGARLPLGAKLHRFETRFYVKYFSFSGEILAEKDDGVGARLSMRPRQNLNLELAWQEDQLTGNQTEVSLTYSYGYSTKSKSRTLRQRMTELHQRDIDIRETSRFPDNLRTSNDLDDAVVLSSSVVHIDNANTDTEGGDGSFENPYTSFDECNAGDCADSEIIYVHAGSSTYDTTVNLANGQDLIGSGIDYFGISAGEAPLLESSDIDGVVILSGNNEVAGLNINSLMGDIALRARNPVGDISIHDNQISSVDTGILVESGSEDNLTVSIARNTIIGDVILSSQTLADEVSAQTSQITDNTIIGDVILSSQTLAGEVSAQTSQITDNTIDGELFFSTSANGTGEVTQNIEISGNTLTSGIGLITGDYPNDGGAISQTVEISGNTLNGGVYLETVSADASELTQIIEISGNTLNSRVALSTFSVGESTLTQTHEISGNTIGSGFSLSAEAHDSSTSTQTIEIAENTIEADFDLFILGNDEATATQSIAISENTVGSDFRLRANANGGSTSTQTIEISENTVEENFALFVDGDAGATVTQTIEISGNTAEESFALFVNGDAGATVTQTVGISGNTLQGLALFTAAEDEADLSQTIDIVGNTLQSDNEESGVVIRAQIGSFDGASATQTFNIIDNTITSTGFTDGIFLGNQGVSEDSQLSRQVTLEGNNISTEQGVGVYLSGDFVVEDGAVASDTILISNNTISSSDNTAINVSGSNIEVYGDNTALNRDIEITGNTISGTQGISSQPFDNGEFPTNTISREVDNNRPQFNDTLLITDNNITANGDEAAFAIDIVNTYVVDVENEDPITAINRITTITGNTLTSSDSGIRVGTAFSNDDNVVETVVIEENNINLEENNGVGIVLSTEASNIIRNASVRDNTINGAIVGVIVSSDSMDQSVQTITLENNTIELMVPTAIFNSSDGGIIDCNGNDCPSETPALPR